MLLEIRSTIEIPKYFSINARLQKSLNSTNQNSLKNSQSILNQNIVEEKLSRKTKSTISKYS